MVHPHAIDAELQALEQLGLLRAPDDGSARRVALAAAEALSVAFIDASSNDYLGLAGLQAPNAVSRETEAQGTPVYAPVGSGASRLVHGSRRAHVDLERSLADWVSAETALLFSSGFAANLGLLGAVAGEGDVILSDALNHASIVDGCRLSRARVLKVPHLDVPALEQLLSKLPPEQPRWFVTESYFSMDGDGPQLSRVAAVCQRYGAGLIVDEAHALGVMGTAGAGLCSIAGVRPDAIVGTLGKAVGSQGAFVAGSASLRSLLWNRARSFVFSTAPSPLLSQISMFHVKQVQGMEAERARLAMLAQEVRAGLQQSGVPVGKSFGPIIPVLMPQNKRVLSAAARLAERGILAQAIRSPTVPLGSERLRITLQASLSPASSERLVKELAAACHAS